MTGQSAQNALRWLKENKFVHIKADPDNPEKGIWEPLDLGLAACSSGLTPEQALMVHKVRRHHKLCLFLLAELACQSHVRSLVNAIH